MQTRTGFAVAATGLYVARHDQGLNVNQFETNTAEDLKRK